MSTTAITHFWGVGAVATIDWVRALYYYYEGGAPTLAYTNTAMDLRYTYLASVYPTLDTTAQPQ